MHNHRFSLPLPPWATCRKRQDHQRWVEICAVVHDSSGSGLGGWTSSCLRGNHHHKCNLWYFWHPRCRYTRTWGQCFLVNKGRYCSKWTWGAWVCRIRAYRSGTCQLTAGGVVYVRNSCDLQLQGRRGCCLGSGLHLARHQTSQFSGELRVFDRVHPEETPGPRPHMMNSHFPCPHMF